MGVKRDLNVDSILAAPRIGTCNRIMVCGTGKESFCLFYLVHGNWNCCVLK